MEVAKETPTISKLEKSVRSHVVLALDHQTDRVRQKSYYPTTHFNAASIFDFWGGGIFRRTFLSEINPCGDRIIKVHLHVLQWK